MSGEARCEHPWKLVGPWYRWSKPGVPAAGRASRPVFQKYASTSFMDEFLAEPQRSLKFKDEDQGHRVVAGKISKYALSGLHLERTGVRKLFLPTHGRFYLVVCELCCDVPGFPRVARDGVCEAGFVVRRRRVDAPAAARKKVSDALIELSAEQAKASALKTIAAGKVQVQPGEAEVKAFHKLRGIAVDFGVRIELEGWFPGALPGTGSWKPVAETPEETEEAVYPLYPLIPDPARPGHSAAGRTIWFGVVPAGGSDQDEKGNPRFDDRSLYEIRCFVRRHKPCCPKKSGRGDCPGPLVWSEATERYQLASHFDLEGTNLKPVNIQLPDLKALEAQASALPFGESAGVRMISPPDSAMEFEVDGIEPKNGRVEGAAICSFAIPLITIVASFVLSLFLPIVVFVFQLWFLLLLKFCIPPSFAIDAGFVAALDADLATALDLKIEAGIDLEVDLDAGFKAALKTEIHDTLVANFKADVAAGLEADYDLNALGKLTLDMGSDFTAEAPPELAEGFPPHESADAAKKTLPAVSARLEYHERLERPEAFA